MNSMIRMTEFCVHEWRTAFYWATLATAFLASKRVGTAGITEHREEQRLL
jgi:hypothetical protein